MSFAPRHFGPIDFKTRFPALDGIRALAVTMVFLEHFGGGAHGGMLMQAINQVRLRLGIGVDVFFVLSGFLITGILYDTRADSHFFKRFFARRSVRIFPVMYLLFAIIALLTPFLHYQWQWRQAWFLVYLGNLFANNDFSLYGFPSSVWKPASANIGHLWSLCVEEQFYVVWPVVLWLVKDRVKLLWISAALCAGVLGVRLFAILYWDPQFAERWVLRSLPFRLDSLLFGAILALLLRGSHADRVQRSCKWLFLGGLVGFLCCTILSPSYTSHWGLSIGITFTATMSAGLIGMTLRAGSPANRLFSLGPLRVLGKYSYGFYVYHVVWQLFWIQVLIWCGNLTHSSVLAGLIALPVGFATSFLMAKLSYDLFEVKFLRLKRRFEYDSELKTHRTAFAADGN